MIQPLYRDNTARVVAAVNLAVIFMGSTLLSPLYPLYQRVFGFSELTLTLVYAAYVIGNVIALFFLGRLSDQIGRRRVSLWAIGLAWASTVCFLFASGTTWLFVARVLSGLAIGLGSGTSTAWIAELSKGSDKSAASVIASSVNMLGLAVGPLMAGLLAQYAPAPLQLSFAIYLALMVVLFFFTRRTQETIAQPVRTLRDASLEPRLGVPREIRAPFLISAVTAFATFAMVGFYVALTPTLLITDLHQSSVAVAGDIVSELFLAGAAAILLTRWLKSRTAMLSGLALLVLSLILLVIAQELRSFQVILAGAAVSGLAAALGFRGSLQVINQVAPAERRAEVISCYLVACYLGNSLPIIGIGLGAQIVGPDSANLIFAAIIALCALAALITGMKFTRKVCGNVKGRDKRRSKLYYTFCAN